MTKPALATEETPETFPTFCGECQEIENCTIVGSSDIGGSQLIQVRCPKCDNEFWEDDS